MAHQILGVAWMIEKEQSFLKGGCLADEMGLGKVSTFNIVDVPLSLNDSFYH